MLICALSLSSGIVPMVCEDIFKTKATKTNMQVEVTFSMLEIYSEVVRDLLNAKGDKKTGLQVREDPKNGFYRKKAPNTRSALKPIYSFNIFSSQLSA